MEQPTYLMVHFLLQAAENSPFPFLSLFPLQWIRNWQKKMKEKGGGLFGSLGPNCLQLPALSFYECIRTRKQELMIQ